MASLISDIKTLKKNMVCRKIDNETVLVPLVNEVAEMKVIYTLNEVATFIWEKIDDAESLEEIANAVVDNFEIDNNTALNDVKTFFDELQNKSI